MDKETGENLQVKRANYFDDSLPKQNILQKSKWLRI
jgi:hypothetical protein